MTIEVEPSTYTIYFIGYIIFCIIWVINRYLIKKRKFRIRGDLSSIIIIVTLLLGSTTFFKLKKPDPNSPPGGHTFTVTQSMLTQEPVNRLGQFKSLMNPNVFYAKDKSNVALIIVSESRGGVYTPATDLAYILQSNDYHIITNLFDINKLISKGFIPDLLAGKTAYLVSSGGLSSIHHLVVGKLEYTYSSQPVPEVGSTMFSCKISFVYQVIDQGGRIVKTDIIDVTGPGSSKDEARQRGLELLSEKYADRIFNIE